MKPWEILDSTRTPDGSMLELRRHDGEYVIRAEAGYDLMTSRMHGSEDAMMSLACPSPRPGARVLIGGLGMGYTLRATLDLLPPDGRAVVGELNPKVVEWNQGPLGPLAEHPLDDPRTELVVGDVANVIRKAVQEFDAILLDVDNGPKAPTQKGNLWLYTQAGLAASHCALKPGGALAVWSVDNEVGFERQLRSAGFVPSTHQVTAHGKRGKRHIVFLGQRR